jgi:hypothetical protein
MEEKFYIIKNIQETLNESLTKVAEEYCKCLEFSYNKNRINLAICTLKFCLNYYNIENDIKIEFKDIPVSGMIKNSECTINEKYIVDYEDFYSEIY